MAASYNKVLLMGNLTRDPEMRVTPGGLSICKFGLAVNRTFTTKEGEKREEVTFVDVDSFGKQAETISKYMTKGSAIFVEGRLRLDTWDDKTSGEKRSKLGVIVENFQFVGGRGGSEGEGGGSGQRGNSYEENSPPARSSGPRTQAPKPASQDVDDDVPF
jgi:single-strand DNA-binding protein